MENTCFLYFQDGQLDVRSIWCYYISFICAQIVFFSSILSENAFFLCLDIRSPSHIKRHVRIDAIHLDVCRKQYEKITLNPVR